MMMMTVHHGSHIIPTIARAANFVRQTIRVWTKLLRNKLFEGCGIPTILDVVFGPCGLEIFARYFNPSFAYIMMPMP